MSLKEYLKEAFGDAYTEEIDTKVGQELGAGYIPKQTYTEQSTKLKNLEAQSAEQTKQLETLKKSAGDNAELLKQIETFKAENQTLKETQEKELQSIRFEYALDSALTSAGAKSAKAVKGFLDVSKLTLDGENIIGLKEQIDSVKKSDAYLFEEKQDKAPGGNPPGADDKKRTERPKGQVFL